MVEIQLHEVKFQLAEPHEFSWLTPLGEVFAVFDQQDSGNISFGIHTRESRLFIKYAGAKPHTYQGEPAEAVARLKQAVRLYQDLESPHLIRLVDHFAAGRGYAAVFEWFEGDSLHPHWAFPPPAKYTDPQSPYFRFKQLPIEERLRAVDAIFTFHQYVCQKGYVAVDFYDGSIMYDFASGTTKICDIDLYQKRPFVNHMGRLWGSKRFMSPEEFTLGAEIDEITNVYNMGATAFACLGGETDRSYEKWEAGERLYRTALRAVEQERSNRFSSMDEFVETWRSLRS